MTPIRTSTSPFATETNPNYRVATSVLAGISTTYDAAQERQSGIANEMYSASGTPNSTSKSPKEYTRALSYARSGNVQTVAPNAATLRNTDAQDVRAPLTELMAALTASKVRASTPLKAEAWQAALSSLHLSTKYPTLINSILHGFDAGVPTIKHTFTPPNPIPNHNILSSEDYQKAFQEVMSKELTRGRWLGPYPQSVIEEAIGPFQTSPISFTPKSGNPGKFRLVQNFSYPHRTLSLSSVPATISSINSQIDSTLYPCLWGTFANTCRLIWTLPPGSQGAVRDISEAYRTIPLHPSQWAGIAIRVGEDEFCLDTRDMFGLTSAPGTFGHVVDAGMDISRGNGLGPLTKWVDDHLWLRILRKFLLEYNLLRVRLRDRVALAGGIVHKGGRLLYQGHTLPNGQREEFDDDFVFPIQDLSNMSPRSAEEAQFTYSFDDIDRVTNPLGYSWVSEKDIPFCFDPIYFGFQWHLDSMQVSIPIKKRHKYLNTITEWETRSSHNAEQVSKLYGQLIHVCLVLTAGRAYLVELEKFLADLNHEAPFTKHRPPRRWPNDLAWWKTTLSSPIFASIPGPANLTDIHAYSDASSGYGIGLYIRGFWRSYRLLPGWRGVDNERDIGWAEAVGFLLLVHVIAGEANPGHHYKVWGDNEGVVEGWWNGRSRNRPTNLVFRSIHQLITSNRFHVHTRYVTSADNPADPFSRGIIGPKHLQLPRIPIPENLSHLIINADDPLTAAEHKERGSSGGISYKAKPRRQPHRDFEHWRLENEASLLSIFQNSW